MQLTIKLAIALLIAFGLPTLPRLASAAPSYRYQFVPGRFTKLGRGDYKARLSIYLRDGGRETLLHRLELPASTRIFTTGYEGRRLYLMIADDRCAARLYMRIEELRLDSAHRVVLLRGIAWWKRNRQKGSWAAVLHEYGDHRAMCTRRGRFRLVRLGLSAQGSLNSWPLASGRCLAFWTDLSIDQQQALVRFSKRGDALIYRCGAETRRIPWL